MIRQRVAIVAYNHPESTLPLVKHLAGRGFSVDYYFVTFPRQDGSSAFSFGRKVWFPGLRWNNKKYMKSLYDYMNSEDVRIFLFVLPPYALRHLLWLSRLMFKFMGNFLGLLKYDYINVVGQNPPLVDLLKGIGSTEKLFVSLHEVTPHNGSINANSMLMNYLVEAKTNIIVHSKASHEKLLLHDASLGARSRVIPFGVFETYSLFENASLELNLPDDFILYYGSIFPYKGLDVLFEAIKTLGPKLGHKKVVVAGHGDDPSIQKMKRDSRFIVINRFLTNHEIVALNKAAFCVVCPYKSASQSGIISTSYFFSLPMVASDVGGFREYITDGVDGILVEPNNPRALSEALAALISSEFLHSDLRAGAARFSTSAKYSWEAIVESYIAAFQDKPDYRTRSLEELPNG